MSFATLGIDISKDTLDVALYQDDSYRLATFTNEKDGYRRLAKWLKKHKARECRVCIEATAAMAKRWPCTCMNEITP